MNEVVNSKGQLLNLQVNLDELSPEELKQYAAGCQQYAIDQVKLLETGDLATFKDIYINSMDEDTLKICIDGPQWLLMVTTKSFMELLDAHNAINFLEVTYNIANTDERISVIILRPNGKTPTEIRKDLEAQIEELRAKLAAYEKDTGETT